MRKILVCCCLLFAAFCSPAMGQTDERDRGIELYRSGSHAESVSVLEKVVEADPTDKVAWTYLGGSLMHLGKKDEALTAFRKPPGGPDYDGKFDKAFRVTRRPPTGYTPEARKNRVNGTVVLMVEFKGDGEIGFVVPIKSLPFGLTEAVAESMRKTKFTPAVKDGKPVPVIRMVSSEFNIN